MSFQVGPGGSQVGPGGGTLGVDGIVSGRPPGFYVRPDNVPRLEWSQGKARGIGR